MPDLSMNMNNSKVIKPKLGENRKYMPRVIAATSGLPKREKK